MTKLRSKKKPVGQLVLIGRTSLSLGKKIPGTGILNHGTGKNIPGAGISNPGTAKQIPGAGTSNPGTGKKILGTGISNSSTENLIESPYNRENFPGASRPSKTLTGVLIGTENWLSLGGRLL